jgi:hypothetical protein
MSTRRSFSGEAIAKRLQRGFDDVHEPELAHVDLLVAREAQQVGDRALDAVELFQRDLGVADVLPGLEVLAHLLHQALGRRDRVADLVGDRGRELFQGGHVLALQLTPLVADVALDLLTHLSLDEAVAKLRGDDGGEVVADDPDAPGQGHDERGAEARDEEQKDADRGVGDEVPDERELEVRAPPRFAVGPLLGAELRTTAPPLRLDDARVLFPAMRHGAAPDAVSRVGEIMGGPHSNSYDRHDRIQSKGHAQI